MNTKPVTFVVAFTVDASWCADGFMLTDEGALAMLQNRLPSATSDETSAKVLHVSADLKTVFGSMQGYRGHKLSQEVLNFKREAPYCTTLQTALSNARSYINDPGFEGLKAVTLAGIEVAQKALAPEEI